MGEQKRKRLRPVAAATAVAVMTLSTLTAAAPSVAARPRPDTLQRSLDRLVRSDGLPAALASVTGRDGRTRTYVAGAGDLTTGAEVPRDGQVRIGSNTKTFTAVVVLQLVGEGRVGLDAPVETYLPGLVRGDGIDGRHITVRQLLQHMSGLPNYTEYDLQPRPYDPRDLLDIALRHKAHFAPGTKWEYSNTNYVLAGLIVEKVTGRDLAREIDRRIIQRLGLRHTYFPAPGDVTIREPHPHGYHRETADGPLRDITDMDPSWSWAAGQLISTNSDLNRFFSELLRGRLLPDAQLAQMRTTVPADYFGRGAGYGLGLVSRPLSCGGVYWGHGGSFPGYETRGGATEHGRRAAHIAVTTQPADKTVMERVDAAVDRALCP
ncbi:serine hydrolase [Streptomyces virginiae]|uniref:Serine hydrolase n=2 Tax=Streptomyces TaxID=1883 RepID=A0ABQ3NK30_STRVG|nr:MULTISPECIES: serine hydrolase domain-containing protein [Streptomyces]KOU26213.1 beta-lactamase [Streptomyces sp. WM6349]KOU80075.1 beta-lactamase [Streptomyces sp. XY593]KOV54456.1 beta-lactamase [Streptomyces sp. H036]MBP2342970.1 D-alanyl-D-alanine carboxypeptidase [Streptomyces virginiae]RST05268.1 class A beta-lactamase-related serine hydrolase [Streptomyces sp. WAC05950]